ncbi:uncharacterized protein LOC121071188 isoform X1 [Cygnus olor]|uniref:uncharacterized protein LOC121071188 isoform X1 n=1 Tax=Cygnus olor TaxID=8869 RepID=UPI001ADE6AA1|nr:uncharacterized protein LOC121071188 isoform X1 [Cygnus olor]
MLVTATGSSLSCSADALLLFFLRFCSKCAQLPNIFNSSARQDGSGACCLGRIFTRQQTRRSPPSPCQSPIFSIQNGARCAGSQFLTSQDMSQNVQLAAWNSGDCSGVQPRTILAKRSGQDGPKRYQVPACGPGEEPGSSLEPLSTPLRTAEQTRRQLEGCVGDLRQRTPEPCEVRPGRRGRGIPGSRGSSGAVARACGTAPASDRKTAVQRK